MQELQLLHKKLNNSRATNNHQKYNFSSSKPVIKLNTDLNQVYSSDDDKSISS